MSLMNLWSGGAVNKGCYNSRRYHSFFEGYTERLVLENGKRKIERIYTGDYYRPKLSAGARALRRAAYCALYVLALALYVFCATRRVEVNLARPVAICQGLEIVALLWLSLSVAEYAAAGENMKARVYRTASRRLAGLSLTAAGLFVLMSLAYLALPTLWGYHWQAVAQVLPCSLLAGLALLGMYCLERNTAYEKIANNQPPVEGGREIKY